MKLLGNRNWYLPSWLQWLPHLGVEGPGSKLVGLWDKPPGASQDSPVSGNGAAPDGGVPVNTGGGGKDA